MQRIPPIVLFFVIAMAGLALSLLAFTPDDAYITFRYSRNLAEGNGPVYNPGDAVEGYTNFLWMLVMTLPHFLGIQAEIFSHVLGAICFLLTVAVWHHLLHKALVSFSMALAATLLLATQSSVLAFSVSGMETSLNLLLWSLLIEQVTRDKFLKPHPLGVGFLAGLCLLSRPDGFILLLAVKLFLLVSRDRIIISIRFLVPMALCFLAVVVPWIIWKIIFYGEWLPNTFSLKAGSPAFSFGWQYLAVFSIWTLLPLGWFLSVFSLWLKRQRARNLELLSLILVPLWLLYILWIGGDFMEFRMMVPVVPSMILLWLKGMQRLREDMKFAYVATFLLLAMNFVFYFGFGKLGPRSFVLTREILANETGDAQTGLAMQGKAMQIFSGLSPDVLIATGPAGALPYYSKLNTVDMLGLNDKIIAREGIHTGGFPGHTRFAHFSYILSRKVHLVLGRWVLEPGMKLSQADVKWNMPGLQAMLGDYNPQKHPVALKLICIPIGTAGNRTVAVYVEPHPGIDRLISENGWEVFEVK